VAGAEQAAEKLLLWRVRRYQPLQGLKPNVDFIGFIGTTEVMPCYKAFENRLSDEFFRSL